MLKCLIWALTVSCCALRHVECHQDESAIVFPGSFSDDGDAILASDAVALKSPLNGTSAAPLVTGRRRVAAPPVPAGNLSTTDGDAVCYSVGVRFYCVSNFRANYADALKYCRETKTKLVYFENVEEQHGLYDFLSDSPSSARGFLTKNDFASDGDYVDYVMDNASPGLLVRCAAFCGGNLRQETLGRVMDYANRDVIGAVIKVQWTLDGGQRVQRWYPAGNVQLIGYSGQSNQHRILIPADSQRVTVEPGHRVVVLKQEAPSVSQVQFPDLTKSSPMLQEIGIVQDVDSANRMAWVYFPAFNTRWQGPVTDLEVLDRRRVTGTYWTSGAYRSNSWTWASFGQRALDAGFTNWAPDRPRHAKSNGCVEIRYHKFGYWYNERCSSDNYFICKK